MDRQFRTQGIILARTDYEEADRIITFLTPNHGKVSAIAKGVRKIKSKLAGGIELFSVSDLSIIKGRGQVDTLISSRLIKHYGNIVKDLNRTNAGYEIIRTLHKATEESPEADYFVLLEKAFEALDDQELEPKIIKLWFDMRLLKLAGHAPDLENDVSGAKLENSKSYVFHLDQMKFESSPADRGSFTVNHIKFLRLGFVAGKPQIIQKIQGADEFINTLQPLVQSMLKTFVRV
jgi:DNA repair protein RecO (recombination protein O)